MPVAFPGAEGFGSNTRSAYGLVGTNPTVYRVTNLNNSGTGSLRAALEGVLPPRVVIFEISGTIILTSRIAITSPYVFVAGATAPSPGITIRNAWISVRTHDIVIQHLRVRTGDTSSIIGSDLDAIEVLGGSYNVVIDHCSFSWAVDENTSTWNLSGLYPYDCTFSNCIISEALNNSIHPNGPHSKGLLIGDHSHQIACLKNIFAHNVDRNPYMKLDTQTITVNNVFYNAAIIPSTYFGDIASSPGSNPTYGSVVGNVYIRGANTQTSPIAITWYESMRVVGSELYKSDNITVGTGWTLFSNRSIINPVVGSPPSLASLTGITILASSAVEVYLSANAGARPIDRDSVDTRIVSEVATRTGSIIDSQSQVGGWPVLAVNTRVLTTPANPNVVQPSGYTNLEEWLFTYAAGVEPSPPPSPVGTIGVTKVTSPSSDPTSFDFTAGGGLSPSSFSLAHGDSETYTDVPVGSGYSIVETSDPSFTTTYNVSNASLNTNISVADGETVTVTVTNTLIPLPVDGIIIVEKVTIPSDVTSFDFTAGGGLSPTTFSLADGDIETYDPVTPGSGYSIVETPDVLYTTAYNVSNASPNTNISVASGETVTVTVTNTLIPPPSPPTNTTYLTAIDITALPYSTAQDVYDSGTTYNVWYKYTATFTGILSVFGFGDLVFGYSVATSVITDPGGTPVTLGTGYNVPLMVPVTSGTDYYIYCESLYGDYDPSILILELRQFVPQTIPTGSIFVNSDQGGQPAAVLSAVDGDNYNVLALPYPFTTGEFGCIVRSSGNFLLYNGLTAELDLYDNGFNLLDNIPYLISPTGTSDLVRANQTLSQFFAGYPGIPATVQVIDSDGTLGTLYTLPDDNLNALTASNDGSIIYIAGNGLPGHGTGSPIQSFLTGSSTLGADLAAGIANHVVISMLTLDDDSVVALYQNQTTGTNLVAKHYQSNGTILHTYTISVAAVALPRMAYATNSLTSFWVWFQIKYPDTDWGTSIFQEIQVSDGTILTDVRYITFNDTAYVGAETATPLAYFGNSDSCPFLIAGTGPPPPPTDGIIIVEKVTVPSDTTDFDFTAGGGLSPTTFTLADGETTIYDPVTPASGYSIVETPNVLYTTVYLVSNASPNTDISVAAGETVTVTVTNTLNSPSPPGSGSGIYKMVIDKRQDTLWVSFPSTVQDVKIP